MIDGTEVCAEHSVFPPMIQEPNLPTELCKIDSEDQ